VKEQYKVFAINLKRSSDRLKSLSQQMASQNIEYERISAIDGKDLNAEVREKFYNERRTIALIGRRLLPGEIGCALSHISVWREIIYRQLPGAFIFEDDFYFNASLSDCAPIQSWLEDSPSVVLLSPESENLNSIWRKNKKITLYQSRRTSSGCGYYINLLAAKNAIAHFDQIHHPIDWWSKMRRLGIFQTYLLKTHDGRSVVCPYPEDRISSTIKHKKIEKNKTRIKKLKQKFFWEYYFRIHKKLF